MNAQIPILEARNLTKHFTIMAGRLFNRRTVSIKAVESVNFSVLPGETLALVGESGCGKTTTTKMLLDLESPTSGSVYFEGRDIQKLDSAGRREFRTNVQAVFQDPWSSLDPRCRVYDLISEPLVVNFQLPREEVDRRVAKVMADVGLRFEQAQNFPHEFSGGQRQRIAVASAIISNPKLIVLDEPVSALDVSVRAQIMNLFKDLQAEYGMSYILVAHDLGTTRYMADKIAVMYLGQVVEIGTTEEIFDDPKHPYTKALFSAALPNHPDEQTNEIILEGEVPSPLNPPSGCPFHPRCHLKFGDICAQKNPQLMQQSEAGHQVACHHY